MWALMVNGLVEGTVGEKSDASGSGKTG